MKKFKIGDRVRLLGTTAKIWSETTLIATIVEQDKNCENHKYTVVFDHHPALRDKPCYNLPEENLILLDIYESPLQKALNENN